jgi:hypothetical protein
MKEPSKVFSPDVFLEIEVPAEALVTDAAGEGLAIGVGVHVER